jgi:hypothetical protein
LIQVTKRKRLIDQLVEKKEAPKETLIRVPGRSLPQGKSWRPHTGLKARVRHLTNHCKPVLLSKDPLVIEQLEKLRELTKNSPVPVIEVCYVIYKVMELSKETGVPVADGLAMAIEGINQDIKPVEEPPVESDDKSV